MLAIPQTGHLGRFADCFSGIPLATSNPHKRIEYTALFPDRSREFLTITLPSAKMQRADWSLMADGKYQELAERISAEKARRAFELNGGRLVAIEETGFYVPDLDGWPGEQVDDLTGPEELDALIKRVYATRHSLDPGKVVLFTTLALYIPDQEIQYRHGRVEGLITKERRGNGGFHWDSVVRPIVDGTPSTSTFAEMSVIEKNRCSSRYYAVQALCKQPFQVR